MKTELTYILIYKEIIMVSEILNNENLDMTIFSFLNKKEEFLQFLPKTNDGLFTIFDLLNFFKKLKLPPIKQVDFYKILSKMVKNKYIEQKKGKLSLGSKNIENYLANIQMEYENLKDVIKEQKQSLKFYKKLIKKK